VEDRLHASLATVRERQNDGFLQLPSTHCRHIGGAAAKVSARTTPAATPLQLVATPGLQLIELANQLEVCNHLFVITLLERRGQKTVFHLGISRPIERVTLCRRIAGGVQIVAVRQSERRTRRAHPRAEELGGLRLQPDRREAVGSGDPVADSLPFAGVNRGQPRRST
jgi:hypothetical protein